MELLIAVAIMIAISELKEWRIGKKADNLESRIMTLTASLIELSKKIENINQDFTQINKHVDNIECKIDAMVERQEAMKEIVDSVDVSTKTILNEHEISGIPMGFNPKRPDFIEGI